MPLQVLVAGSMHIIVHSISVSQYQCIHFTIAVLFTRPPHRRSVMRKRVPSSTQCCKWQASEEVRTHDLHSSTTSKQYIPVHPLGSSSSWVLVSALWTIGQHSTTEQWSTTYGVDRSICSIPLEFLGNCDLPITLIHHVPPSPTHLPPSPGRHMLLHRPLSLHDETVCICPQVHLGDHWKGNQRSSRSEYVDTHSCMLTCPLKNVFTNLLPVLNILMVIAVATVYLTPH